MTNTEFYLIDVQEQIPVEAFLALVKFRAKDTCQECGETAFNRGRGGKKLHTHHIDGNSNNNCLTNGQALCVSCHAKAHAGLEGRFSPYGGTAEGRIKGGKHSRPKTTTDSAVRVPAENPS